MSKTNLNTSSMFTKEELEEAQALEAQQHKAASRRSRDRKRAERRTKLVNYRFNPTADQSFPLVGETVADCHQSQQDKKGNARLVRASVVDRKVKLVYMSDNVGFRVLLDNGDVAWVRKSSIGHTKWETFFPGEKQKVLVK